MDLEAVLSFRAGRQAVEHDVYFNSDEQAVIDGIAYIDTVDQTSYDAGTLELGRTYYWRIDEVNNLDAGSPWVGDIWSFETVGFLVIDDFEAYDIGNNEIWWAWKDGLGHGAHGEEPVYPGNGTGSVVGDETTASYMEQTIVHGGYKSMPVAFNNGVAIYSETERLLDPSQDWTRYGIKTLSLWFHGDPNNTAVQMYVKVNGSKVPYGGNEDDIKQTSWQQCNIDLALFGVDLANVTKLAIGFGDETNLMPGGAGIVYFDDIRLYPDREPAADLTDN